MIPFDYLETSYFDNFNPNPESLKLTQTLPYTKCKNLDQISFDYLWPHFLEFIPNPWFPSIISVIHCYKCPALNLIPSYRL